MKVFILFFVALLAGAMTAKAQNLIAVQKGGAPAFYTDLPTAISKAVAGDTVYIPGGSYPAITISKQLVLIGAGHNPDSTHVTARTIILSIYLAAGSNNSCFTGIYNDGVLLNSNVSGISFLRCYIPVVETNGGSYSMSNSTFNENIIGSLFLNNGSGNVLKNNITGAGPYGSGNAIEMNGSIIRNNLFLTVTQYDSFQNCIIENNIVQQSGFNSLGTDNVFNNNVNGGINGTDGINQGSGNFLTSSTLQTIFTSYASSSISGDGIYEQNFSLPANSPYKNAGTDGTDIGIYGGAFPWKPGSVPFNPHFQNVKISPQTDSSGNLKVQITVTAQNN